MEHMKHTDDVKPHLKLPSILKPFAFARKNLEFSAAFDLAKFSQLAGVVSSGNASVALVFAIKNRVAFATGKIDINAKISCVNCLEDIDFTIQNNIKVAFVSGEFDEDSLNEYEIIDCEFDGEIQTEDFISDEVLLALPMFAKHKNKCIDTGDASDTDENRDTIGNKINPFADLKNVLKGNN